jgi:hypothetical protein
MSTPVEKLAESIGHNCQTGCSSLADVVIVQLATGETDILCGPCHMAMMTAVMQAVLDSPEAQAALDTDPAAIARAAADAALGQ